MPDRHLYLDGVCGGATCIRFPVLGDEPSHTVAGEHTGSPRDDQRERRSPSISTTATNVVEASFQLDAWHYERISLATWSYAHHDLPDTLPPGTCAPELDGLVVTYTFTDHLGENVIDTCDHDVSNEPFFGELDAVFHTSGS